MNFVEQCEIGEKYYLVKCDREKLKEILEKLKDYSYYSIDSRLISGFITKWPNNESTIKRRTISFFNSTKRNKEEILYPETIVHHTEDDYDYVSFDYAYKKLPDLYAYIDLIVNDTSILNYTGLFGKVTEEKTGHYNMFYAARNQDQLVLEGLLNYINSNELSNHKGIKDEGYYDYKGLNELYKETLKCFNFKLVAVKKYLDEPQDVDVSSIKLKK